MAKKEVNMNEELKTLKLKVQDKKAIVGTERVLKELKAKNIHKVFLASNCPEAVKDDIEYYAKLANVSIMSLGLTNEELGVFCKKHFFVSVIGIRE